jgi:hypothetical protein
MNDMVSMRKIAPWAEFARAGFGVADSGAAFGFEDDFLGGNEGSLAGAVAVGRWAVSTVLLQFPRGRGYQKNKNKFSLNY